MRALLALLLVSLATPALAAPEPLLRLGSEKFRHGRLQHEQTSTLHLTAEGKQLVTLRGGTLRFWEATTGKFLREIDLGIGESLDGFDWSPDGKWLATREWTGATREPAVEYWIHLRAADTGKVVRSMRCPRYGSSSFYHSQPIRFFPGSREIAVQTGHGIAIFEVATGLKLIEQRFDVGGQGGFAISADGKRLVLVDSHAGDLGVWDWESGKAPRKIPLISQHSAGALAISPDGKTLALAGRGGNLVSLLDVETGKVLRAYALPERPRYWRSLAITPDGKRLLASDDGGRSRWSPTPVEGGVVQWDIASGTVLDHFKTPGEIGPLTLSADGKFVVLSAPGLPIWELATGKRLNPDTASERMQISRIVPHGDRLLLLSETLPVQLRDGRTGELLHEFRHDRASVRSAVFTPDGKQVVTGAYDPTRVWDTATGRQVHHMPTHRGTGTTVAVRPDGQTLLSVGCDLFLRTTDLRTGKATEEIALNLPGIEPSKGDDPGGLNDTLLMMLAPVFSPDASRLVMDKTLFDTTTGQPLVHLEQPTALNSLPFFTQDSGRLVRVLHAPYAWDKVQGGAVSRKAGPDRYCCQDAVTGETLWSQNFQAMSFRLLAPAPDGKTFACYGGDNAKPATVEFRSLVDGRVLARLADLPAGLRHLAYLPDGRRLAITFTDCTAAIYALPELQEKP